MPTRSHIVTGLVIVSAAAASATCGGGSATDAPAHLHGQVWWGGPVAGATVRAYQLVDGERLALLADDVTGDDGRFDLRADGYEHLLVVADGGRFVEGGATIAIPSGDGLRAIARDVGGGESREVTVSPLTDVLVTLAYARAAAGEPFNTVALPEVDDHLTAHLDFDPGRTPIASLAGPLAAGDAATRHALALRALVELAGRAAADLRVSAQDVSTLALVDNLRLDASSAEARLDGNLDASGAAPLHVGALCPPDAAGARASCRITSNTLRGELAGGVLRYLAADDTTGLARADVLGWVTHLASNDDPALFAGDPPEPADRIAPLVAWRQPADGAALTGAIAIEVTATDDVGVDDLTVTVAAADADPDDPPLTTLVDDDPTPARVAGTLATAALPEGPLVLRAIAHDLDGNRAVATRAVTIDNVHGGTISGLVVKGRVDGATVTIYRYAGGVRGAPLGQGVTAGGGIFTNVALADGYSGPLLIEAGGGGHYDEEAGTATVTLDVADTLRTIVPAYGDGDAPASVIVSPLTSFAVSYRELLAALGEGATVGEQWQRATAALEAWFGVANLRTVAPLLPEQMTTLTAGARYGLVLVGLSELARQASTLGGGDAGSFGLASSSLTVWRGWQQDLADGCWNGRAGLAADAPRIFYGGTQALGDDPTRRALADAIAGYLRSPRNASPFAGVADALPLLDAIATGGGVGAIGRCGAAPGVPGTLAPPTEATAFDQIPPTIAIAPAEDAIVRGSLAIVATATDNLDVRPTLVITAPAALAGQDLDGDPTDADVSATLDTLAVVGAEGAIAITVRAEDDAGVIATATRHLTIDNLPPVIVIDGVLDGGFHPPPRTITFTATDGNLLAVNATLDGLPFASGGAVTGDGPHVLVVTARDRADNVTTAQRAFTLDGVAPTLTLDQPALPSPDALVPVGGVLWTTSAAPTLRGTVSELHLRDVRALVGGAPLATAAVDGATWSLALPGSTIPAASELVLELVARDQADNRTSLTVRLRRDADAPAITLVPTTVADERGDSVTIQPAAGASDPLDLRVLHTHAGAAITLGPPTGCTLGAADAPPRVSKYAYLLDAALPPYAGEVAPANPLTWRFAAADDGIGLEPASVAYRVRDVAADAIVLPWTTLATAIPGSYAVTLHRDGGAGLPSIAQLGTRAGVFELQLRARDRAGHEQVVTRCWQHEPLAAPLAVEVAGPATSGPVGSGKYALAALRLEDATAPHDPVGSQVLSDAPAGVPSGTALVQLAVRNPTTEAVHLTIDLTRPAATYSKITVLGKRTVDSELGTADCGPATDASGDPMPADSSRPWCQTGVPTTLAGTTTPLQSGATTPAYGVRVWEDAGGVLTEISASCPTCNQTAPAGKVRLTVRLPPRPPPVAGVSPPARTFWVVPVVKALVDVRPDGTGPWQELTAGGVVVTGAYTAPVVKRCALALGVSGGHWRCTAKRTATSFNALKSATFAIALPVASQILTSIDGASPTVPPSPANTLRQLAFSGWSTSEPSGL
jgi:hypothetical protein